MGERRRRWRILDRGGKGSDTSFQGRVPRWRRLSAASTAPGAEMATPFHGQRCAGCRGVRLSFPHQANCSHWFCEIVPAVNRIEQYNGCFGRAPYSMILWLLDQFFYVRRMLTEFGDTHLEPLFFKIEVMLAEALSLL